MLSDKILKETIQYLPGYPSERPSPSLPPPSKEAREQRGLIPANVIIIRSSMTENCGVMGLII